MTDNIIHWVKPLTSLKLTVFCLGCAMVLVFLGTLDQLNIGARSLSRMMYGIICFATLFSFVGTILGGIWADQSWGRFWGWDPKENGALLIVLWNAIILHSRWGGLIRERGLAVMCVFGNIVFSLSWFGVNMLGVGLHSYGFMDRAFRLTRPIHDRFPTKRGRDGGNDRGTFTKSSICVNRPGRHRLTPTLACVRPI